MQFTPSGAILILSSLIALGAAYFGGSFVSETAEEYRYAALTAAETGILKKWQESGGIRRELRLGSEGTDVMLLQYALRRTPEVYEHNRVTGYFGAATQDALKRLQARLGLRETGVLDADTRIAVNNQYFSDLCPEPNGISPDLTLANVDKANGLRDDYVPPDLIHASPRIRTTGVACMRADALRALEELFSDAEKGGIYLAVTSGYRRPEIQRFLFDFWTSIEGSRASDWVAVPGHSEHQLGTAADLTGKTIGYESASARFADSPEDRWLRQNAYRFGYILSYPKGKESITGYGHEPWHYRFVGRSVAEQLLRKGDTLNQLLSNTKSKPLLKASAGVLFVSAEAFLLASIDPAGNEEILFAKNERVPRPIASITKLVTALAAEKLYSDSDVIRISSGVIGGRGDSGRFRLGSRYLAKDLLRALLIESNNDAAEAFMRAKGEEAFLREMNVISSGIGLRQTHFVSPSGLDGKEANMSTAFDIRVILKEFARHGELLQIMRAPSAEICTVEGSFCYIATTTNALLLDSEFPLKIKGGKTGETPYAKKNLALLLEAPAEGWLLVSVVLGSDDHFGDTKKLIKWALDSYEWSAK